MRHRDGSRTTRVPAAVRCTPVRAGTRINRAAAALLLLGSLGLAACMTGERASIDTSPGANLNADTTPADSDTGVSVPATAEALALLFGQAADGPETVVYSIQPTGSEATVEATVSRDQTRSVVSIREIQYRSDGSGPRTCRASVSTCTQGFNSQPLSDLNVTARFWGPSVRQELRSPSLAARIGPIRTTQETVAGQAATCIEVPGPQLTDRYCAFASGMLARKSTARVTIEVTSYSATFDEALWAEFAQR